MAYLNHNLPSFSAYIRNEYLYDHQKGHGEYTFADIQSSLGRDPEELFEALDRERKLAEQYNIDYGFSPYGANKTPVPPDLEINEEDEE